MHDRHRLRLCLLASALAICPIAAQAGGALPAGGNYVAGQGTINGSTGALTINQSSTAGIIDWSSFSIAQGNIVQFNNGSGATLNRVTGGDIARIGGNLSATGSIFLIDPQGIVISGSGKVVTGGSFVGSTRDISNDDFISGSRHFTGNSFGNIVNRGQIKASGGDAVLISNSVNNTGTISAPHGTAGLAAGNDVLLQPVGGDQRVFVKGGTGDVRNSGTISAATAELKAANGNVYALAGNNGGIISATGTQTINGHVWLTSNTGSVTVNGNISAKNANGSGGTIVATGNNVNVGATARLSASGTIGGTILIGGDIHGGADASQNFVSGSVARAQNTSVAKGALISADGSAGNGGHIVVWSDQHTDFNGSLSAKGIANGGFAEVSSHKLLGFTGRADLTAKSGKTGTLLLDPENVFITNNPTSNGSFSGSSPDAFTPTADDSVLNASDLIAALSTADVLVTTGATGAQAGDITLDAPLTWSVATTLTLNAANDIFINADITATNGGLVLDALGAVSATGAIDVGTFTLQNGAWSQVSATLPGFAATDFRLRDGTFLRALGGDGSSGSPYQITDVYGLQGIIGFGSDDFILANDIDATGTAGWNSGAGFIPIGDFSVPYTGTFDGANFTIDGLALSSTTDSSAAGLFGDNAGTIQNVNFTNVSMSQTGNSAYLGGIAGENDGTILNATVSGTLTGGDFAGVGGLVGINTSTISGSSSTATVSAGDQGLVGGLVALNIGGIDTSFASGAISDTGDLVVAGGLVGANLTGTISTSHATGTVDVTGDQAEAGGLLGENEGSVAQSYATGTVTVTDLTVTPIGNDVGGLVGNNAGGGDISSSYATGAVIATGDNADAGGLVGFQCSCSTIEQSYASGAVSVTGNSAYAGGFIGENEGAISQSYADGSVSVTGDGAHAGGFVGQHSSGGSIFESYTTASVSVTGDNAYVGGMVGKNLGYITQSYATGHVAATGNSELTGGFAAENDGFVRRSYWDEDSTGQGTTGIGNDTHSGSTTLVGLTSSSGSTAFARSSYNIGSFDTDWFMIEGQTRPFLRWEYSTGITNAHQLQLMAMDLTASYTLLNNIDLGTPLGDASQMWSSSGFVPIGTWNTRFDGSFNGQGFTIDGLSIDRPTMDAVGLFSAACGCVSISDVNLTNVDITGGRYVGALVGYNGGTIDNASASGTINGSSFVGGVAGYNLAGGIITASSFGGDVTGTGNYIGGVAGFNAGTVQSLSLYTGGTVSGASYVGGLVGYSSALGDIDNSSASGTVTGTGNYVGGVAGYNSGAIGNGAGFTSGTVSGVTQIGGLVGQNAGGIDSASASATVNGSTLTGGLVGYNVSGGTVNASTAGGTVTGTGNYTGGLVAYNLGSITASSATADVGGLSFAGGLVGYNGTGSIIDNSTASGDVTGTGNLIGGIAGYNNGQIKNLSAYNGGTVSGVSYVGGLTGYNCPLGDVDNSSASGTITGTGNYVGGITGYNSGTIEDLAAFTSGTVSGVSQIGGLVGHNVGSIDSASANATVNGTTFTGGLVGYNVSGATINLSSAAGTVTGTGNYAGGLVAYNLGSITKSSSTADTNGTSFVGGLVGRNLGSIAQSYARGAVVASVDFAGGLVGYGNAGGTIDQAYATGTVSGGSHTGGLLGYNSGTITSSYWDSDTPGITKGIGGGSVGGASSLTTAQFLASLPIGFLSADWGQDSGINGGFPYLLPPI